MTICIGINESLALTVMRIMRTGLINAAVYQLANGNDPQHLYLSVENLNNGSTSLLDVTTKTIIGSTRIDNDAPQLMVLMCGGLSRDGSIIELYNMDNQWFLNATIRDGIVPILSAIDEYIKALPSKRQESIEMVIYNRLLTK